MGNDMKIVLTSIYDHVEKVNYTPPMAVDLTDLFVIDHTHGTVTTRDITIVEVQERWTGLPERLKGRSRRELTMSIMLQYNTEQGTKGYKRMPSLVSPLAGDTSLPDPNAAYCDGGNRKDGWRKPGRNVLDKRGESHKRKGKR